MMRFKFDSYLEQEMTGFFLFDVVRFVTHDGGKCMQEKCISKKVIEARQSVGRQDTV